MASSSSSSIRRQLVNEIHGSKRKHFPTSRVIVKGLNDLWQADLIQMTGENRDGPFQYILSCIDVLSKYAWAVPLKNKGSKEVTAAFQSIIDDNDGIPPRHVQTDKGSEFYNYDFKKLMKKYEINFYSTHSDLKASVIERWNRTLKTMMYKSFHYEGHNRWSELLPNLVAQYNNTVHRTIKMRPKLVRKKHEKILLKRINESTMKKRSSLYSRKKFNLDDNVRISKLKGLFTKGYLPNYTTEIFQIDGIREGTDRVTYYKLRDLTGQPISGRFYAQEMKKTSVPTNYYLVEKILKRNKKKGIALVKWLGFTKPSWEKEKNIEK